MNLLKTLSLILIVLCFPLHAHGQAEFVQIVTWVLLTPIILLLAYLGLREPIRLMQRRAAREAKLDPIRIDVVRSWQNAAVELGFKFKPYVTIRLGDHSGEFLGLVENFGSEKGTIISLADEPPSVTDIRTLHSNGYYHSSLGESYRQFDPDNFRGTLNDWGYFGTPVERPAWYTGEPWSQKE